MPLTRGQQIFRDVLAEQIGAPRRAVGAWLFAEEGGAGGPASGYDARKYFNYLNIGNTDSGRRDHDPSWSTSPEQAARVTAQWIKGTGPVTQSYGKRAAAIGQLVGKGDTEAFIRQLAGSGWASSGYNGGADLRNLLKQVQGGATPFQGSSPGGARGADLAASARQAGDPASVVVNAPETGGNGLLDLLQRQDRPQIQTAGLAAPSFAAGAVTPNGAAVLQSAGGPQARAGVGRQLALLADGSQTTLGQTTVTGESAAQAGKEAVKAPKSAPARASGSAAVQFASERLGAYAESAGQNRGPRLDTLEQKFGLTGEPWCAMFATTAAAHGGASRKVRTASVADINRWGAEGTNGYRKGHYKTSQAEAGDLITFGDRHVGVVESVDADGNVHTIEGNTSANKVARRVHPPNSGTIIKPRYGRAA